MLCGCGKQDNGTASSYSELNKQFNSPSEKPTPTPNPLITTDETGTRYIVEKLPFEIPYNETSFSIKDVKFLSCKSGKSNELIILVILDISNIPDGDEYEWFLDDIDNTSLGDYAYIYDYKVKNELTSVYLTNDANYVKDEKLYFNNRLHYTDTKELYWFFSTVSLDDARYPYEDCHVKITISAKQTEKAGEYKDKPIFKVNRAIYDIDITKDDVTPLSKEPKSVRDFVTNKIGTDWK